MEIVRKYFIILCSFALLFPSIMSLAHISAHQNEIACNNFSDTHIHKKSLECELCDFRLTNLTTFSLVNFKLYEANYVTVIFFDSYQFLSNYQRLSFELRGPPSQA